MYLQTRTTCTIIIRVCASAQIRHALISKYMFLKIIIRALLYVIIYFSQNINFNKIFIYIRKLAKTRRTTTREVWPWWWWWCGGAMIYLKKMHTDVRLLFTARARIPSKNRLKKIPTIMLLKCVNFLYIWLFLCACGH